MKLNCILIYFKKPVNIIVQKGQNYDERTIDFIYEHTGRTASVYK